MPSNVLVLDEPTNDLDIETLELLEQLLMEYKGTVLVVSHDRAFLNNVVTSTLVFEGKGRVQEYAGGYDDWLRQIGSQLTKVIPARKEKKVRLKVKPAGPGKLTFKETRELEELPGLIETLEQKPDWTSWRNCWKKLMIAGRNLKPCVKNLAKVRIYNEYNQKTETADRLPQFDT